MGMMIFLLYNKVLLRVLVALGGGAIGLCAWFYIALSSQKLAAQGVRDALAIISFVIAGWLVMVIAEVVDNHYVRAFACLCVMLGGIVSFRWIFLVDGPELRELAGGPAGMSYVTAGYWIAMLIALGMLVLLVTRLALDKINAGRIPARAAGLDERLGAKPEGMGEPAAPEALPAIPVDTSPLPTVAEPHAPTGPVRRLRCIGGLYMDTVFELPAGEHRIGRSNADLELGNDNQVSRHHAVISVSEEGTVVINDAGSTNGTFINNQRIQSCELAAGDVIRIGTSQFKAEE